MPLPGNGGVHALGAAVQGATGGAPWQQHLLHALLQPRTHAQELQAHHTHKTG